MRLADITKMSFAEYLVFEAASDTKHEFLNGEVIAMAGGSIAHGALAAALTTALSNGLRYERCRVLSSDVRVRVQATGLVTYPDVTVVCDKIEVDPTDPHAVINPSILVEILSDSTEADDRGAKAAHYRRIPSLREYVLVSQREPLIEVYRRNERGNWELYVEARSGQFAYITSCGESLLIDVDRIYRDPMADAIT